MTRRFAPAAGAGGLTLAATLVSVFVEAVPGAVLVVAAGAPVTVLLAVRALLDVRRSVLAPLALGATVVPLLVVLFSGLFAAAAAVLVAPALETVEELFRQLRTDRRLVDLFTSGWAIVFIVELAVVAPITEETLKPLAAIVRRPESRAEAFLFGVAAGTGFAVAENLLYASGYLLSWEGWLPISIMRMSGAALHGFGAGLITLGLFEVTQNAADRRALTRYYITALGAHAAWNATIAVTVVLFSRIEEAGAGFDRTAFAWGAALAATLAAIGAVVLASTLVVARSIARGDGARPSAFGDMRRPEGVAAWAWTSAALVIPVAIAILVYPGVVAL